MHSGSTEYLNDGYNITTDSFFTSAKLAVKLLQKKQNFAYHIAVPKERSAS